MSLIQNIKHYPIKIARPKQAILLCGFGGAIWQTKRLTSQLNRLGYDVTALDFPKTVLSEGDPRLLPMLVDEVVQFAEDEARKTSEQILLVGISLGSLLTLNILRRSDLFDTEVLITGGNIVTVAQNIFGTKVWPQTHDELSDLWKDVNIFTAPGLLKGKRMLFVLPTHDKLIDTTEVRAEITLQNRAGNTLLLVGRGSFGHVGTIIEESVLFPVRIAQYIEQIKS